MPSTRPPFQCSRTPSIPAREAVEEDRKDERRIRYVLISKYRSPFMDNDDLESFLFKLCLFPVATSSVELAGSPHRRPHAAVGTKGQAAWEAQRHFGVMSAKLTIRLGLKSRH